MHTKWRVAVVAKKCIEINTAIGCRSDGLEQRHQHVFLHLLGKEGTPSIQAVERNTKLSTFIGLSQTLIQCHIRLRRQRYQGIRDSVALSSSNPRAYTRLFELRKTGEHLAHHIQNLSIARHDCLQVRGRLQSF
ncbi:hypothetical protein [Photorhabdus sp. CRCIA-P01]|uniref:hypothetical protein n=1 Tax=Photorhabdus sp. CRCIA-P01 TaxID=2019570 RepID=UPI001300BA3F|nr:hypothetical protein [Photorhabdus sp. CRCIA-P01]